MTKKACGTYAAAVVSEIHQRYSCRSYPCLQLNSPSALFIITGTWNQETEQRNKVMSQHSEAMLSVCCLCLVQASSGLQGYFLAYVQHNGIALCATQGSGPAQPPAKLPYSCAQVSQQEPSAPPKAKRIPPSQTRLMYCKRRTFSHRISTYKRDKFPVPPQGIHIKQAMKKHLARADPFLAPSNYRRRRK